MKITHKLSTQKLVALFDIRPGEVFLDPNYPEEVLLRTDLELRPGHPTSSGTMVRLSDGVRLFPAYPEKKKWLVLGAELILRTLS